VIALRAEGRAVASTVFVTGNDAAAIETVAALVREPGFEAVPAGPLTNARYLEPMVEQLIQLGYGLGHGDKIGFALVKEA
ncbi:hypothetical protein ABNX41_21275, partial [Rhodobacteraceae bacterium PA1-206B]